MYTQCKIHRTDSLLLCQSFVCFGKVDNSAEKYFVLHRDERNYIFILYVLIFCDGCEKDIILLCKRMARNIDEDTGRRPFMNVLKEKRKIAQECSKSEKKSQRRKCEYHSRIFQNILEI